jgi:hypothetical protein
MGEEILRGVCRGRHEFITRDFRRNARLAVLGGLDTHNLSQTADIYIARPRDLLWKSDDELNFAANFEIGISKEIESAVTDIPRVGVHLASLGLPWENPHWQTHRESPRFAAFRSINHLYPLGCAFRRKANIGPGKLQRENQGFLS